MAPGVISSGLMDNQYATRMTYDTTISYPDDIIKFDPYVILRTWLLVVSHPNDL